MKRDPAAMNRFLKSMAGRRKTVTYGELMKRFHLSRGPALSRAIARADEMEYSVGAPGFAAIIVRKDTRYPGGGFFCDEGLPASLRRPLSRSSDPRLSVAERSYVRKLQGRIWASYSR